jgi:3-phenylpropionate/cinnamic acid dioxygenase small subunit
MDHRHHIENLLYRYAARIDAGDFEGVAELFRQASIHDAENREVARGYEGTLQLYQASTRLYENGTPCTRHVTTNLLLEIAEDAQSARGSSYFTVLQQLPDFPLQTIIAGRYEDEFVLREQQWHFARRQMFPEQFGDLSRHLLIEL